MITSSTNGLMQQAGQSEIQQARRPLFFYGSQRSEQARQTSARSTSSKNNNKQPHGRPAPPYPTPLCLSPRTQNKRHEPVTSASHRC